MIDTELYDSDSGKDECSPRIFAEEKEPPMVLMANGSSTDSEEEEKEDRRKRRRHNYAFLENNNDDDDDDDDVIKISVPILNVKRMHKSSYSSSSSSSPSVSPSPLPSTTARASTTKGGSDCIAFCCCHPCFEKQRYDNPTVGESLVSLEKSLIVLSVVNFVLSIICSCFYPLFLLFYVVDLVLVVFGFVGSIAKRKNFIRIFYGFSALFVLGFIVVMIVVAIFLVESAISNNGIVLPSWKHYSKMVKRLKNFALIKNDDNSDDDDDDDNEIGSVVETLIFMTYFFIVVLFVLDIVCRIKTIKAAKDVVIAMNNEESENNGNNVILKNINVNNSGGNSGAPPENNKGASMSSG